MQTSKRNRADGHSSIVRWALVFPGRWAERSFDGWDETYTERLASLQADGAAEAVWFADELNTGDSV